MNYGVIGERVLLSRRDLGMNQDVLASQVGVNRAYISKIESQKVTNTTVEVAFKLAEALGVSLPYLIGLSDIPLMPGDEDDELAGAGRVVFEARSVEERDRMQRLVDVARRLTPGQQQLIVRMAEELAGSHKVS